ncbi:MAG: hypothetical protein AAF346_12060 [Pseudomonadota bacterium]
MSFIALAFPEVGARLSEPAGILSGSERRSVRDEATVEERGPQQQAALAKIALGQIDVAARSTVITQRSTTHALSVTHIGSELEIAAE